jgi:hypothetical protein
MGLNTWAVPTLQDHRSNFRHHEFDEFRAGRVSIFVHQETECRVGTAHVY